MVEELGSAMDPAGLRLPIELVPASAWGQNLRALLPEPEWQALRRRVVTNAAGRCMICGARSRRLHCHEVWQWDDERHVQRLLGCQARCALCHHVAHIGLAGRLAADGRLDLERVIRHFMRVNGCDRATFQACHDEAMRRWEERSRHEWTLDLTTPAESPTSGDSA
jgi:hypothetical protein